MKNWCIGFVLLFSILHAKAQDTLARTSMLTGVVSDSATAEAMPFCTVLVQQDNVQKGTAQTDLDGNYRIKGLAAGMYSVRVTYIGYRTKTVVVFLLPGEQHRLDIRLEQAQQILSDDPISYAVPLIDPDVQKVDPEDVTAPGKNNLAKSRPDTVVYFIDGERIPASQTVTRADFEKMSAADRGYIGQYEAPPFRWWQWRKKRRWKKRSAH